jgi:hypothetical protein
MRGNGNSSDETDSWRKSKAAQHFTRAIVQQCNGTIGNLAVLDDMAKFLNASISQTTYGHLLNKLVGAAATNGSWLDFPKMKSDFAMRATDVLVEHISFLKKSGAVSESDALLTFPGSIGRLAPQTDQGYYSVMALKSDAEMNAFISRAAKDHNFSVNNSSGLAGLVPWFSGVCAVQTYSSLVERLRAAARRGVWLTNSSTVANTRARNDRENEKSKTSAQAHTLGPKAKDAKRKNSRQNVHLPKGKAPGEKKQLQRAEGSHASSSVQKTNFSKTERSDTASQGMHLMTREKNISHGPKANSQTENGIIVANTALKTIQGKGKGSTGRPGRAGYVESEAPSTASSELTKTNASEDTTDRNITTDDSPMKTSQETGPNENQKKYEEQNKISEAQTTLKQSQGKGKGSTGRPGRAGYVESEAPSKASSELTKNEIDTSTMTTSEEIAPDENKETDDDEAISSNALSENADEEIALRESIESDTFSSANSEEVASDEKGEIGLAPEENQLETFPGLTEDSSMPETSSIDSFDSKEEESDDEKLVAEEEATVVRELQEEAQEELPETDHETSGDDEELSTDLAENSEDEKLEDEEIESSTKLVEDIEESEDSGGSIEKDDSSSGTEKRMDHQKAHHKPVSLPVESDLGEKERDNGHKLAAEEQFALSDNKEDENEKSSACSVAHACALGGFVSFHLLRAL